MSPTFTRLTLALPATKEKVLLGFKKRGLGAGRWNGFGGKAEDAETIEAAAVRELEEEIGLAAQTFERAGTIWMAYQDTRELTQGLKITKEQVAPEIEMAVFRVTSWEGLPQETAEMKPAWFVFDDVPYGQMWPDDRYWLPLLLAGKYFEMRCVLENKDTLLSYTLKEKEAYLPVLG